MDSIRTCSVDECNNPHDARGYCAKHYARAIRSGEIARLRRKSVAERLSEKLALGANGCLEWQGHRLPKGYGQIHADGRHVTTHRLAWELSHGPIPDGLHVLHSCDNPPCCNLEHLSLGTAHDNLMDMSSKRRHHNQRKTHCIRGHELAGENIFESSKGHRRCRQCGKDRNRARYLRLKN